jgi:hypothetical protein
MWGSDGKASQPDASQGAAARRQGPLPQNGEHTSPPGTAERETQIQIEADALETPAGGEPASRDPADPGSPPDSDVTSPLWLRLQARRLLREFLRAVPRDDPQAPLTFIHPDGTARLVTREQLSVAIDRMRPRMRQILRLSVEERWPRQKVCDYLKGISIKTFERDQVEALDLLVNL